MVTLAQLQAEPWWGREIVTVELDWLGDEICRRTGQPRYAAGTKGDVNHLRGAHRSQEWILKSVYCTNRTYTVQSGLSADQLRHIAGFDFTPGSGTAMVAQCKRLYAALRAGELEEVREFYGNVDGDQIVDGWNNIENRVATSDSSHLWHWHLSIDRRRLTDKAVMERILAVALGLPAPTPAPAPTPTPEESMLILVQSAADQSWWVGDGITRRPVPDEQTRTDLQYIAKQAGVTVKLWPGAANLDAFGAPLPVAGTVDTAALAAALAPLLSPGATVEQIRQVVDEELDEQSRGGADTD
jgi:hypothetical protein